LTPSDPMTKNLVAAELVPFTGILLSHEGDPFLYLFGEATQE